MRRIEGECLQDPTGNILHLEPGETLGVRGVQHIIIQVSQHNTRGGVLLLNFIDQGTKEGSPVLKTQEKVSFIEDTIEDSGMGGTFQHCVLLFFISSGHSAISHSKAR